MVKTFCDICGEHVPEPGSPADINRYGGKWPRKRGPYILLLTVRGRKGWDVLPPPAVRWDELCEPCGLWLKGVLQEVRRDFQITRKRRSNLYGRED